MSPTDRVVPQVGQTVQVLAGATGRTICQAKVESVSPQGVRVRLSAPCWSVPRQFYRRPDSNRYVNDPGAGLAGHMLNDWFLASACQP